jgi:hypothetical protein
MRVIVFVVALLAFGSDTVGTAEASRRTTRQDIAISRCLTQTLRRYPAGLFADDALMVKERTAFYEACMRAAGYKP